MAIPKRSRQEDEKIVKGWREAAIESTKRKRGLQLRQEAARRRQEERLRLREEERRIVTRTRRLEKIFSGEIEVDLKEKLGKTGNMTPKQLAKGKSRLGLSKIARVIKGVMDVVLRRILTVVRSGYIELTNLRETAIEDYELKERILKAGRLSEGDRRVLLDLLGKKSTEKKERDFLQELTGKRELTSESSRALLGKLARPGGLKYRETTGLKEDVTHAKIMERLKKDADEQVKRIRKAGFDFHKLRRDIKNITAEFEAIARYWKYVAKYGVLPARRKASSAWSFSNEEVRKLRKYNKCKIAHPFLTIKKSEMKYLKEIDRIVKWLDVLNPWLESHLLREGFPEERGTYRAAS